MRIGHAGQTGHGHHHEQGLASHRQSSLDAHTTVVTIKEDATSGPARLMPKPVRDAQLHLRNIETLKRLAFVVEGRTR